jgi:hypothetical protein
MPRGFGYCLMISRLCRGNVGGLQTLRTFLDIKVDRLAFGQRLESVSLDCGEVHEHVVTAISRCNKTEALGLVKPLYSACSHVNNL